MSSDGVLGWQLALYRSLDTWEEIRRNREQANSLGLAHAQLDWVMAKHNDLVRRHNQLVNASHDAIEYVRTLEQGIRDRDAQITELDRQLKEASAEQERLRILWIAENQARMTLVRAEEARYQARRSQQT
jgi:hypothetical protein